MYSELSLVVYRGNRNLCRHTVEKVLSKLELHTNIPTSNIKKTWIPRITKDNTRRQSFLNRVLSSSQSVRVISINSGLSTASATYLTTRGEPKSTQGSQLLLDKIVMVR